MKTWSTWLVVFCLVIPIHSSSLIRNYAMKMTNKLGIELEPKRMASSFFSKVDKCMEDGNVTSLPVSPDCLGSLFDLVYPMKTLDVRPYPYPDEIMVYFQWSKLGRMLDSWGKVPGGIFEGNTNWLGSYQQCKRVPDAKYCINLMRFTKLRLSFDTTIFLGTCVPEKCSNKDIRALLNIIQEVTDSKLLFPMYACDKPYEYSKGNIITIFVLSLIIAISIIGAIVEIYFSKNTSQVQGVTTETGTCRGETESNIQTNSSTITRDKTRDDNDGLLDAKKTTNTTATVNSLHFPHSLDGETGSSNQTSPLVNFLSCFSLLRNTKVMTSTTVIKDSVQCVNGLRFFTTCVITAGHMYITVYSDDRYLFKRTVQKLWFMPIANSPAIVDIFFLMSGFLVSYLTLKWIDQKEKVKLKDLFSIYIHRYIRLTPALIILMLVDTYILPLIQSGPLTVYHNELQPHEEGCEKSWWTNVLYINNFHTPQGATCVDWVWYLAVDTQIFMVSPFILALMIYASKRLQNGKEGLRRILGASIVSGILIIISFIIRAYLIHFYKLPSVALFSPSPKQMTERDYDAYWHRLYVKPYARCGPYIVGMFVGYIISRKFTISDNKWKPVISAIGWLSSITIGFLSIYGPHKAYTIREFSNFEILTYGTFSSVGVAVSFAWLIYACHDNMGGIVNTFLSWPGWIPLSRISYGAYLYHPMVINYFQRVQDKHIHYQQNTIIFTLTGLTAVSYALGALSAIFVEIPMANLEKKLFSR